MLGVMLDCSRNAVMKVSELKNFIIKLQKMGYDCLQLYTEDTYEIEGEPQFGYMRGKYTKEELKEVDAFAKEHGVELMPCIQTLAHLNQIMIHPKYQEIRDFADILLVDDERTYDLVDKMFKTCADCFTSRKINIGMDEAHMLGLGKYLDKHGYTNRADILLKHLARVCDIAKKYGFTPMMWSDMFFRLAFGGNYYADGEIAPEIMEKVPDNIELCYWDYYRDEYSKYDEMFKRHLKFNRPVWFAGGAWKWNGINPCNQRSLDTTCPAIKACIDNGINNILITMWGDNGGDCPPYATLPALVYAAECAKGNFDIENSKNKFNELFGENWDDFMSLDIRMPEDWNMTMFNGAKEMLYSDCFLGRFDSCVSDDGREAKVYKEYAEKFKNAKQNSKNYSYIFDSFEKLCRLMVEKYDLGYVTRKAYQNKDVKQLKLLIKRYKKCIKLLDEFVVAHRKTWFETNKPHGFDVQEIRLGGARMRLQSCANRLADYVSGKIDKIEELEEKLANFYTGGEPEFSIPWSNVYEKIATVNIL